MPHPFLLALFLVAAPAAAQEADRETINRIADEGFNRSEVMQTAAHLTDRIGARLPNSPPMRQAEAWTQQRFKDWGLRVRAEPFLFGRGWSIRDSSAWMTSPRRLKLSAIPIAWTPATSGQVSGPIIVAPIETEEDFAKWRGKLGGRIVLVSPPGSGSEPTEPTFRRFNDSDLARFDTYVAEEVSPSKTAEALKKSRFAEKRDAFLKAEGALAWARISKRDGGLIHGNGYGYRLGRTPSLPAVEIAAEDYRRLARLALNADPPILELVNDIVFHDDDANAYNIIAEIDGRDRSQYVLAGAHLDSWVAGDGAQDNAAGSAIVMEAARILARLKVRPRRSIRFALWNAEEQGLLGSMAYIERHIATRGPLLDPAHAALDPYETWPTRWPIIPAAGHRAITAYFNIDNGSGKIRGFYGQNNLAAVPILQSWLKPFRSMGASMVALRPVAETDHLFFDAVGIPAFSFIQDPLDYHGRIHHTNVDTFDHLKAEDMRQAAVVLASVLLSAASHPEPLPRKPIPLRPSPTDRFEYPQP